MRFNYHLPFNKHLGKIAIGFVLLIIIGISIPFEFKSRTGSIILSNNILMFTGLIFSVLFGIIALVLKTKTNNSRKNPYHLELTDTYLQFPKGKSEVIKAKYETISSVVNIGNNINGIILQVKPRNNEFLTFYIQANGFESIQVFNQFEQTITQKISHQN